MKDTLDKEERTELLSTYRELLRETKEYIFSEDFDKLKTMIAGSIEKGLYGRVIYGLHPLSRALNTALIVTKEIGLKRSSIIATMLSPLVLSNFLTIKDIAKQFDKETTTIIEGLTKIQDLYNKNAAIDDENFRSLLLTFAEDVRVILILIADRLYLMRSAKKLPDEALRLQIAEEASYLYAPLSHRLGLYTIKSELEDLSLKTQDRETYDMIARKLNETKRSRDKYIAEFIAPVKKKLEEQGFSFEIKGRTKSIHSINNKLRKQKIEFESIYDLFAIRIVIDTSIEKEKSDCWQAYSVITDMYQPNPKRLKDWLSVPKSNGYESLHITVMGPEGKWVEVQIRTKRMDEIAEKGLAAHWKYKGVKDQESGLDNWLTNVREVLEHKESSSAELIQNFKMELYDEEIYVFTPKGDLFKLPHGATVLDFAFAIHTTVGSQCVSGKVNGKNVSIRHKLKSGDQVEIQTASTQTPKQDWLNIVVTSRAQVKIRQSLKEQAAKQVEYAKELLHRRFKNRKIEEDESLLMRIIRKRGYKTITDFYADIANEYLDPHDVIEQYIELQKKEEEQEEHIPLTVENYVAPTIADIPYKKEDVLVIDQNLTGVDYTLAKCCNPIFGDKIFAFVSSKGIKIHRMECRNAPDLFSRYGYRVINARWSGRLQENSIVNFTVIGNDDMSIITNITSLVAKEKDMMLRNINLNPADGLFQGTFTISVTDAIAAENLSKKISKIKGVKSVHRTS